MDIGTKASAALIALVLFTLPITSVVKASIDSALESAATNTSIDVTSIEQTQVQGSTLGSYSSVVSVSYPDFGTAEYSDLNNTVYGDIMLSFVYDGAVMTVDGDTFKIDAVSNGTNTDAVSIPTNKIDFLDVPQVCPDCKVAFVYFNKALTGSFVPLKEATDQSYWVQVNGLTAKDYAMHTDVQAFDEANYTSLVTTGSQLDIGVFKTLTSYVHWFTITEVGDDQKYDVEMTVSGIPENNEVTMNFLLNITLESDQGSNFSGTLTAYKVVDGDHTELADAEVLVTGAYLQINTAFLDTGLNHIKIQYSGDDRFKSAEYEFDVTFGEEDEVPQDPLTFPKTPVDGAVYRFYNKTSGTHIMTMDYEGEGTATNNNPAWQYDGIVFKAYKYDGVTDSCEEGDVVYRFVSPTLAYFYAFKEEADANKANNPYWQYEGPVFCAKDRTNTDPGTVQAYRYYNQTSVSHFFTASQDEITDVASNPYWKFEEKAFVVMPK